MDDESLERLDILFSTWTPSESFSLSSMDLLRQARDTAYSEGNEELFNDIDDLIVSVMTQDIPESVRT